MILEKTKYTMPIQDNSLAKGLIKANEKYLMEELKRLDEEYKAFKKNRLKEYIASLPESLNLEKKSYDALSDEQLKEKAEKELSYDYESGKTELIKGIEKSREIIEGAKDKFSKGELESLKTLDKRYQSVKESIGNEALKRGLARSSIVMNKLTEAELSRAEQAGIIENSTKNELINLDRKIEELEKDRMDSLKAFDLSHAVKVQKELDKLIAERDKKAQAVIDYNNKIGKDEADYLKERSEKIESYKDKIKKDDISDESYFAEHGYYPSMKDEYEERYAMAYNFYMKLSAETARRILNENPDLEKYLGTKYYNKLKTIIIMRK